MKDLNNKIQAKEMNQETSIIYKIATRIKYLRDIQNELVKEGDIKSIDLRINELEKLLDSIVEDKLDTQKLSAYCDNDCEPHPSDCHDCNVSNLFIINCSKCGKKHCDGEFCSGKHPWQLYVTGDA